MDIAEFLFRGVGGFFICAAVRDVKLDSQRLPAVLLKFGHNLVNRALTDIGYDDIHPLFAARLCKSQANPTGPPGDKSGFPIKFFHKSTPFIKYFPQSCIMQLWTVL
jgi:hypothetical protein